MGSSKKTASSLSPEEAATALLECAEGDLERGLFARMEDKEFLMLWALFRLTNVAIVVKWLRLFESKLSGLEKVRAAAIRSEFERLHFLGSNSQIAAYILSNELHWLGSHSTKLMSLSEGPEDEFSQRAIAWCKEWLGRFFKDQDFIESTAVIYLPSLTLSVRNSIKSLGKVVEALLFDRREK